MGSELETFRRRFNDHLDNHREEHDEHIEDKAKQEEINRNTLKAVADLTQSIQVVVDFFRVIILLQKFAKWLSGFAILGGVAAYFWGKFSGKLP